MLKKITATVSPPNQDCSELSLKKQPPSLWVTESDSVLFTDVYWTITAVVVILVVVIKLVIIQS